MLFRRHLCSQAISLALALPIFTAHADTLNLQGQVLDAAGQPVKNAKVHVHGRQQYVFTDTEGRFSLQTKTGSELHIAAKGFNDQFVAVSGNALKVQLEPGTIEHLRVSASGLHHYDFDMAQPASVLSGEALKDRLEPTIGETLKFTPGVHSNYYGPVAAAPVIRGLDGPRVKVLSNGLDSADVSRVGPDHAISADAITTEQIEVLRGPATLLYGSGAIGGVVNLVDNRIPRQLRTPQTVIDSRYSSVSDERAFALSHDGSLDQFAWHLDGFDRQTNAFDTPTFVNDEGETQRQIANSALDNQSLNLGGSWVGSQGLIGLSYGRIDSQYGIPGHHHHHEETADETAETPVYADLTQDRYGLAAELYNPFAGIETLSLQTAYTDYQHGEIEDGVVGTGFKNRTLENRLSLEHADFYGWHGLFGLHSQLTDFKAQGEEAFAPPSKTDSHALFLLEERSFGALQWQLGGRLERLKHRATLASAAHDHEHDSDHDADDHDDHSDEATQADFSATAFSLSSGLIWQFQDGYQWSLQLSHSARAPGASELYANGLHIATRGYEVGLGYHLHDDGELHYSGKGVAKEVANNLDLGFQKTKGDLTFSYNFFINEVDDFIYQAATGLTVADLHAHAEDADHSDEHDHDEEHEHGHDEYQVYQYLQADARLYGAEMAVNWRFAPAQQLEFFADRVNARLKDGGNLPRIPPYKLGLTYQYQGEQWNGQLGLTHYGRQDRISAEETVTAGYTLLDASLNYDFSLSQFDLTAYLKASNLTDKLARVHSSFIKDDAPLPGRNISLGLTARF